MRYALSLFALFHGVAHLPGFLGSAEMPPAATRLERWAWLALTVAFALLALGIFARASWWLAAVFPVAVASAALCLVAWPVARYGIVANLILLGLTAAAVRYSGPALVVHHPGLEQLWSTAREGQAVRLWMHGELKLGGRWWPFTAEQVIAPERGMVWAATVSLFGLPVRGADLFLNGAGQMKWKLFDLVDVARGDGPDVTRSARERMEAEAATWLRPSPRPPGQRIVFPRWGNPEGGAYHEGVFGVEVEEERVFAGRRIPSRIRAGWFADSSRFDPDGVFFRATIDRAEYK